MEVWKDVVGYEGFYQISNFGRIKRILKFRKERNHQERILNPSISSDGYYRLILCKYKTRKNANIHRLVSEAFIENIYNKPQVNHKNGVKTDNSVKNLEWVTAKENCVHATSLGLNYQLGGELHHMSKLTSKQVCEIFDLYINKNILQKEIAKIYSVSQSQISRILNFQRWKDYDISK
jgi:predicted XRE-type DNA-binding protein